jgi:hypothetical protein
MKIIIGFTVAILCAGCASNSGVALIGPDTYIVSRQAATGFSGSGSLKVETLQEANSYCESKGRVMLVVSTTEAKPPYILGNYPKAEVQFRCLKSGDPELTRPTLHPEKD